MSDVSTLLEALDDFTPEFIAGEIARTQERLDKLKAIQKAVGGKKTRKPKNKKQESQSAEA
ncbi:MAG: hypothetical protein ACKVP2_01680 [Burkholderiales bacterium]